MKIEYKITEASPSDASLLSDIAYQSKQYWGYPDEWMQGWKNDLRVTEEMITEHECYKAIDGEVTAGYALITTVEKICEIEHCFVHPDYIGKGCGTTLLNDILQKERYRNREFLVLADPNAVPFYEKYGFIIFKEIESSPAGRKLPYMKMNNNSF